MKGMVNKGIESLTEAPELKVRELTSSLATTVIDFEDVHGFKGEPINYYRGDLEGIKDKPIATGVSGNRVALAVATCLTRCINPPARETCVTLNQSAISKAVHTIE